MYSVVTNFLELLGSSEKEKIEFSQEDTRTAIAVLFYKVVVVDGKIRDSELRLFRRILSDSLNVSEDELMLFEDQVFEQVDTERSLFPFTSIIKKLPIAKRLEIVSQMEQLSLSDRELHEFEINLVAHTAELLGVSAEWNAARTI